jgi:RHS repeat-associated protein
MKIKITTALALFFVIVMGDLYSARATLTMRLSADNGATWTVVEDNSPSDIFTSNDGIICYVGPVGDWTVSLFTGFASPLIGSPTVPIMDASTFNISGGPQSLIVQLSDTGFIPATNQTFIQRITMNTDGVITFNSYRDSGNILFGTTSTYASDPVGISPSPTAAALISQGPLSGLNLASNSVVVTSVTNAPYSLTLQTILVHTGSGMTSTDGLLYTLPPPCDCTLTFNSPAAITNDNGGEIPDVTAFEICGEGISNSVPVTFAGAVTNGSNPTIITRTNSAVDDCGTAYTFVQTIVVTNFPPVVDAGTNQLVTFPDSALLTGTATDDGLPSGTLTYLWTKISGPGTATLAHATSNSTTVFFTAPGVYTLQLTASDSLALGTNRVTITVNTAPVAADQSMTFIEDSSTNVFLQATDAEGDPLTFIIVSPPSHGTLVNQSSSNQYAYTPATNYFGDDSFTFKVNDGHADSAAATVSLTVLPQNDAPAFAGGTNQSSLEDAGPQTITLWASNISPGPANESTQSVHFVLTPDNPSLFLAGPAVLSDGTLTFTSATNTSGTAIITMRAQDDGGTNNGGVNISAPQTFTITVAPVNDAPQLSIPGAQTTGDAMPLVFGTNRLISVSDVDAGSEPLELSLSVSNGIIALGSTNGLVFISGTDSSTNVVIRGNLNDLNTSLSNLTYTSVLHFAGTDTLTLLVSDLSNTGAGGPLTDLQSILISVVLTNHAPVFVSIAATNTLPIPLRSTQTFAPTVFDLSAWHVLQFGPWTEVPASWSLSQSNTLAAQAFNADASILLSDVPMYWDHIEGTLVKIDNTDNDFIGFVFGFQNSSNFYLFDWKEGTEPLGTAVALVGMSVKVITADPNVVGSDALWSTFESDPSLAHTIYHNSITYDISVNYKFSLDYRPGDTTIQINNGTNVVANIHLTDTTYPSGKFGFYNFSQRDVRYFGFLDQRLGASFYTYQAAATDSDSDTLTYSLVSGPTNMSVNATNGLVQWLPDPTFIGQVTVIIQVSDGHGGTALQTFPIFVPDPLVNIPPFVDAGPDRAFSGITNAITLNGAVVDDGVPTNTPLVISWTKVFGPGNVTFGNSNSAVTTASFSAAGLYRLQLVGSDSLEFTTNFVNIRADMLCSMVAPTNIVAWLPATFNARDEITDTTGTSNVVFAPGKVGPAFSFENTNFVHLPSHSNYDVGASSNGFTVEFWMNPIHAQTGAILGWANGVRAARVTSITAGDGVRFFVTGTNTGNYIDALQIWAGGNWIWTHVAMTYNQSAGLASIYINGVLVGTTNVGPNVLATSGDFWLGQVPGSAGNYAGMLDEVSIYSRVLNPEEIYNIFASGTAGKCPHDTNVAPLVFAGPDLFVRGVPGVATLGGEVSDDSLPVNSQLHSRWTKFSGPGTVGFTDASSPTTTATFSTNGIYVLQLTADDGEAQSSDLVEVRVEDFCSVDNPSGLVAWWPANGIEREAINGYDAILANGVGYAAGMVASAFNFDGTNDYVRMPAQTNYDIGTSTTGFSVEFWINPAHLRNGGVVGWENGVRAQRFNGGTIDGDSLRFYVNGTNSGQFLNSQRIWDNSAPLGKWFHIVLTYQKPTGLASIYVDGFLNAIGNLGTNVMSTAGDFYLQNVPGSPGFFSGQMDEISLYSRPLSRLEVLSLFKSGSVGKCLQDSELRPRVYAGADIAIASTNVAANLSGTVIDDGLPAGSSITTQWQSVNKNPGTVTFSNANSLSTTATFSTNGVYALQLFADDGEKQGSDFVEVRVGVSCPVLDTPGLVAWWPANGNAVEKISGASGFLIGADYTNGEVAQAFNIHGTNDIVFVPAQTNYDVGRSTNGFTLEFWTKGQFLSGTDCGVLSWNDSATNGTANGVLVRQSGFSVSFDVRETNGTSHLVGGGVAFNGNWHHLAVTYDRVSGQCKTYLDGVLQLTSSIGTFQPQTGYDLQFGRALSPFLGKFLGQLDEIGLYTRPLTQTEVQAIFNAGAAGKCITPANIPPIVTAGADKVVSLPNSAVLDGIVVDDGLPSNTVAIAWTYVAGDSTVFFSSTNTAATTVTFTNSGTYTFQLSASDGQFATNDTVTVTVLPDLRARPTVTITTPPDGSFFEVSLGGTTNLTLTASATDADGQITNVEFFVNGSSAGAATNSPYSIIASNKPPATYTLTAIATDNDGLSTTSGPVTFTVYVDPGQPDVAIFRPTDSITVTAPTNIIGTANSTLLASYQIRYRLAPPAGDTSIPTGSTGWTTLATGNTSVVSNTLALFDPTMLLNGIYEIQVVASDLLGRTAYSEVTPLVVDRNLKIGQFTISFNDLSIPVPGLPLQITRTYDSRAASLGLQGDFGTGWTLDIHNVRLQKNRSLGANWEETSTGGLFPNYALDPIRDRIVSIIFPDGNVQKFRLEPNPSVQPLEPIQFPRWRFTPIGNTHGTLEPASIDDPDGEFLIAVGSIPGTIDLYDLNYFSTNTLATTEDLNRYPTLFRYTSPEGYRYLIDEINGLQSVIDPNGNTLLIGTNGIAWTNSIAGTNTLSVAFHRDSTGRITNIVDAVGNAIRYAYSTNGNLVSFTDRVGQTNGFAYTNLNFPHHLTGIIDARGLTPIANQYDDAGRLVKNADIYGHSIQYQYDTTNFVASVTDRNGHTLTQEYDVDGNVIRATDALGGVTTCTYDDRDHRLTRTNPLGQTERYFYSSTNAALIAVVSALGQTNMFEYNAKGQVTRATERDGTPLFASYDGGNNITQVVDTLGIPTAYAYNPSGKTIYSRDALGNEVHAGYDAFGNLIYSTNALGHVSKFGYDANNRITTQVLSRTNAGVLEYLTNSWTYDAAGRVTAVTAPDGSVHQTFYDPNGHIAVTIDELGRGMTNNYDLLGRLVQTIYADGTSEGYTYDAADHKTAATNRLGQITFYIHDALNRPVIAIFPDGTGTTNFYDSGSRLVATSDARGNTTHFGYDAAGRTIATTNALGEVSTFAYDPRGNQITSTDALGRSTTNVFDLANRLIAILYPDGSAKSNQYDVLSRKVADTDQSGHTTLYGYDALGRLISVTNALGQVTRYEYDDLGEQTAQIDASGRITRYVYDDRGRRVSRILPLGQSDLATFDDFGNMTDYRDFNGNVTTYQYDPLNRLIQKIPDSRLGEPSVTFAYNSLGLRTNMVDASGVTTFGYDARNRLIEKATPQGTLTYSYDANGNVTNVLSSNLNGTAIGYEYDALNRLSAVNDLHLGRTTYAYDPVGNLQGFMYPNWAATTYTYDSLNRLTNVLGDRLINSQARYDYSLDASGHRTSVTELGGRVVNYAYDVLYQLTNETVSGTGAGSAAYSYDTVGNRLARNSSLPGILANSYSYDANDRLNSDTYDANGNTRVGALADPISGLPTSVSDQYDFENRLVNRNNGQIQVVYGGDGNRARKIATTSTNTITTYYLADALSPSGSSQVVEELTKDTATPSLSIPTVTRVYVWGHALISQDRLHGSTWTESYYGYDGQGSVRYLTDANGNITDTYDYDAFGNLTGGTGTTPNNYLYQGEQYDQDLKLYYLRSRYADPDRGRFWTMDSFEGFGTDPKSLHKYTFNQNDPINRRDPSGHFSLSEVSTVSGLAPTVRGALMAFQQSLITCRIQSGIVAGTQGATIGAALGGGITSIIQIFTGNYDQSEVANAMVEGAEAGFKDGFVLGAWGDWRFMMMAYNGYQSLTSGLQLFQDLNNPEVPLWQKYMDALTFVTSALPVVAPNLARQLFNKLQQFCFPADTEVATADGPKRIDEVKKGDLVWSQSDKTGEIMPNSVKRVFVSIATSLVILHCGTNTLTATPSHPLWVADQGWKSVGEIQLGDRLWSRQGTSITVSGIEHKEGQFTVYNFEVEESHTYFVGQDQVLSHNASCWKTLRERIWKDRFAQAIARGEKTFSSSNLRLMQDGKAPRQRVRMINRKTGEEIERDVSQELHHIDPQRNGGSNASGNLQEVDPWEHETIDSYRNVGWDLVEVIQDIDEWTGAL